MIAHHLPLGLLALSLTTQVYPDPTGKDATQPINLSRPENLARAEHRIGAKLADLRGLPGRRVEYADELSALAAVRFFAAKRSVADFDNRLTAYRIHAELLPPGDPKTVDSALNLAEACVWTGRHAEAERYYAAAWRTDRDQGRGDAGERAERLSRLARLYEGAGRDALAAGCARRAIELRREAGLPPRLCEGDWEVAARVAARVGDLATAKEIVEMLERTHPGEAAVRLAKARYCVASGDDRAAGVILCELLEAEAARRFPHPVFRADIRAALAGVLARTGDPDRGRLLMRVAIDAYRRTNGPRCPRYADAVAEYERLFPDSREDVAGHVAAIRAAARDEELKGPAFVLGEGP